jgi:hypothetical protein
MYVYSSVQIFALLQYSEMAAGIYHDSFAALPTSVDAVRLTGYLQSYRYFDHIRTQLLTSDLVYRPISPEYEYVPSSPPTL